MPAAVETMAYTNEVPWHGLGTQVGSDLSVKQMLKAAGLDWRVELMPLMVGHRQTTGEPDFSTGETVEGFSGLVRTKDRTLFDIVGGQYTPTQNEDAFEFFREFVEAGKARMETAGSLRGGRLVWALANLQTSFKLSGNDVVKGYLLLVNPHQQGKARIFKFTSVRVVCMNTLSLALRSAGGEHRQAHRGDFDGVKIEQAKTALGIARDQLGQFEENARKLQKIKMTRDKTLDVLMPIFAAKSDPKDIKKDFEKNAPSRLEAIMKAIEFAPGAQPENAWGVLNGVTYWADHIASRSADKRLTNAWLGKTAVQKEATLEALLTL